MNDNYINVIDRYDFNFDKLKADTLKIIEECDPEEPQICLTHTPDCKVNKLYEGAGSLFEPNTKEYIANESDFTVFNDAYKDTYLYDMYKSIPDIGRFRIMIMVGPMCLTTHNDLTARYHYAIETNEACVMIFPAAEDGKIIHIPQDGKLYHVNTKKVHNFVNGSRHRRIHLLIDDLSTLEQK